MCVCVRPERRNVRAERLLSFLRLCFVYHTIRPWPTASDEPVNPRDGRAKASALIIMGKCRDQRPGGDGLARW